MIDNSLAAKRGGSAQGDWLTRECDWLAREYEYQTSPHAATISLPSIMTD